MQRKETTGFRVPKKEIKKEEQQKTNLQLQVDGIQILIHSLEQRIKMLEDSLDGDYIPEDIDSMDDDSFEIVEPFIKKINSN